MKGLVLYQPWAYFTMPVEPGTPARKRLETRGQPIGGLDGASGKPLPGCGALTGERVAILAGADRTGLRKTLAGGGHPPVTAEQEAAMASDLRADGITSEDDLAWGAVIGTARLGRALEMHTAPFVPPEERPHVWLADLAGNAPSVVIPYRDAADVVRCAVTEAHDQQHYGVWAPGRWAIELDDPVKLRQPVPIRGRQGLHELRDTELGTACPRCFERMLTTAHHEEHDWCPWCGWVDE